MSARSGKQSTELETLDQLLGGPMSVTTIRSLYEAEEHFVRAVNAMLHTGQLRLMAKGEEVPQYRWREVLRFSDQELRSESLELDITDVGARRVA
jgi:hypothetical protein